MGTLKRPASEPYVVLLPSSLCSSCDVGVNAGIPLRCLRGTDLWGLMLGEHSSIASE